MALARPLQDLPDLLAVAKDVADRAVGAVLGLANRLAVGIGEDVLLLDDVPAGLRQLVDPVQFHARTPPAGAGQGKALIAKGKSRRARKEERKALTRPGRALRAMDGGRGSEEVLLGRKSGCVVVFRLVDRKFLARRCHPDEDL